MWSLSGLFCIVLILVIIAALTFLEAVLSLRQNKWYGIFIPVLWFFGTIAYLLINPINNTWTTIGLFLLLNVPTIIYLLVFLACREKLKMKLKP